MLRPDHSAGGSFQTCLGEGRDHITTGDTGDVPGGKGGGDGFEGVHRICSRRSRALHQSIMTNIFTTSSYGKFTVI